MIDDRTLAILDRPGNGRIDIFLNVIQRTSIGLVLLVPGILETCRISGRGASGVPTQRPRRGTDVVAPLVRIRRIAYCRGMILAFGDVELDAVAYEIRLHGRSDQVQPQVFDVLWHFASNAGRLVTKEELLDEIWGDRFVSESALTTRIKDARRAVGDDGTRQAVIATVHGRGYRFLPEVEERRQSAVATCPTPSGVGVTAADIDDEPIFERDAEIQAIEQAIASARRGAGRLVWIAGEAGLGKSMLVRSIERRWGRDTPTMIAGCDDLMTPQAFGPFRELARANPELPDDLCDSDLVTDAVMCALDATGADRGCIVVIEDVHWADDATLDLLRQLGRWVRTAPVCLVATYRSDEIDIHHPLHRLVGTIRGPFVSHLRLSPLRTASIAKMVRGSSRSADEVMRLTGGNPLFVSELVDAPDGAMPENVLESVLARIARLPPDVVAGLQAIALLPSRAERQLVESLSLASAGHLGTGERRGMLNGDATHVWYRHELVRRAIESTVEPTRAVEIHRRLAAALHERRADSARVVHHARLAGDVALVVTAGRVASIEAERAGAQRQVVEHIDAVLSQPAEIDDATRSELLRRRAHSLDLTNRFGDSMASAVEAVRCAERSGDERLLVEALLTLGRTALWDTGPDRAIAAVSRALEELGEGGDPVLRAQAHTVLARAQGGLISLDRTSVPRLAMASARRAHQIATEIDRQDLVVWSMMYEASERLAMGDAGARQQLDEAIGLVSDRPGGDLAVRVAVNAARACRQGGFHDDALHYVALGVDLAKGAEYPSAVIRLQLTRAATRAAQGRWTEAIDELTSVLESPGDPGIMRPMGMALLARLLARTGEVERARTVLEDSFRWVRGSTEFRVTGPILVADVEVAWLADTEPVLGAEQERFVTERRADTLWLTGELLRYLQFAGVSQAQDLKGLELGGIPEPWASGLRGDWARAAELWSEHHQPYERALEFATGDDEARASGRAVLMELGGDLVARRLI